jgi:deoxyribonuclease-4
LLNDARFGHAAFIAETPVDEDGNEESNVRVLQSFVAKPARKPRAILKSR